MTQRKVYLGHIDIGRSGLLDLRTSTRQATAFEVERYLFLNGLIADEVLMQGSAPMKSIDVFSAYRALSEAFVRNEFHEPKPIFAFVLSDEAEDYSTYIQERLDLLKTQGSSNAERFAYLSNDGLAVAKKIDEGLSLINVPRRTRSVSKAFRRGLIASLESGDVQKHSINDETAKETIKKISESVILQTFALVDSLEVRETEQLAAVYALARNRYRQANAFGSDSINSDDSVIYDWSNVKSFFEAIGLAEYLNGCKGFSSELLFKLRQLEPLRELRDELFKSQSQRDIDELFSILKTLRVKGRIRSTVADSPAALAALVFEGLNEAKIGYKSINKAAEFLSKSVLTDAFSEHFAKRCFRLFKQIDLLQRELKVIFKT
jgi:hypothetical protein